ALKTERKLRIFCEDAFISVDYQKKSGVMVRRSGNVDAIKDAIDMVRNGQIADPSKLSFSDLVKLEPLPIEQVEPARAQLDAFVDSVISRTPPTVSARDGLAAVALAHQIVQSIATQSRGS